MDVAIVIVHVHVNIVVSFFIEVTVKNLLWN